MANIVVVSTNGYEAPSIIDDYKERTIVEGGDVTLYCLTQGVPKPTITWSKKGYGKSYLKIKNLAYFFHSI